MTTLLVDIGNSRLKWAIQEQDDFTVGGAVPVATVFDQFAESFLKNIKRPERIIVSNVSAQDVVQALAQYSQQKWGIHPDIIQSQASAFGVHNAYQNASQLGPDRWAALVWARHNVKKTVCLIDCGTAVTIDVMNGDGYHLGGVICPGLGLSRSCLYEKTGIPVNKPGSGIEPGIAAGTGADDGNQRYSETLLGSGTGTGIRAGTLLSIVGLIEKMAKKLKDQFQEEIEFIISGGDAEAIRPHLDLQCLYEPDMVLKGLAVIGQENNL